MVFGAADLRAFCRQMGVPVSFQGVGITIDGQPVMGLFDRPVQNRLGEQGFGGTDIGMPEVRIPFNSFLQMPAPGDEIYVDGKAYTVADATAEDDGGLVCYGLKLA